jgi:protoheme IX farnesyltransferase
MPPRQKLTGFARYAWMTLGWNLLVILWGVFLRASKSGDGCGQHWLTCQGEVIPSAPELKTIIEFSHRITSSLAGIAIIVLLVWAIKRWRSSRNESMAAAMRMAIGSFVFVVFEGLLGRSLVLTGNTALNLTPERPFWMAAHLINTFILLAFLTLTAYYASGGENIRWNVAGKFKAGIALGALAIFVVGVTGSIAALAGMIFPSGTLAEGLAADLSPTSNMLVRLRLLHPITAIAAGVTLIFIAGWLGREAGVGTGAKWWSNVLSLIVLGQLLFGAATLLMLAPIVMQLGHLFLADATWISFVMMTANFLSRGQAQTHA